MAGFNYTFGGMLVEPSQLSYLAYTFPFPTTPTPNQLQMNWPVSFIDSAYIVADILDITTSAPGQSMVMPPANQVSNGQQVLINNLSANSFTIYGNDATTVIIVILPNTAYLIYLYNNNYPTTVLPSPIVYQTGQWRAVFFGPGGGGGGSVTSINATSSSPDLVIGGVPITTSGTITFALAGDLLALSSFGSGTGYLVRTAANTYALRSIVPVNSNIAITNQNGVAGNTSVGLNNILTGLTSITVGNLGLGVVNANTISSTNVNGNVAFSPNGTGVVSIGNGTNAGTLALYNAAGTFFTSIAAPAALAADVFYTLPLSQGGANTVLSNDGAGHLSWAAAGGSGSNALQQNFVQVAHGFVDGDIVQIVGTNTFGLAQANNAANAEAVGIITDVIDVNTFTLQYGGYVTSGLAGLTSGDVYFLSPTVGGALTAVRPTTVGQVVKPLIIALSATTGFFFNMLGLQL